MQTIPNVLIEKLKENGGEIYLKKKVEEIILENGSARGVRIGEGNIINAKAVVSNADITSTFKCLIKGKNSQKSFIAKLDRLQPSLSIYIVYLILNQRLRGSFDSGPGLWCVYNLEKEEKNFLPKSTNISTHKGVFCSIASKLDEQMIPKGHDQLRIMTCTKNHGSNFWKQHSINYSKLLISVAAKFIPDLDKHIVCVGRATSLTMQNYTFNRNGAMCGWLNSTEQVNNSITNYMPSIKSLFFVGHWMTNRYGNGGVAMVADSGRKVARLILKDFNKANAKYNK